VDKPKRNSYFEGWKLYFWSALGHHAQGAATAIALMTQDAGGIAAACVLTFLYVAYQSLTLIRKGDSAGLDVADFIAGFLVGLCAYLLYQVYNL